VIHSSFYLICFDVFIVSLEQPGGIFESILFFLGEWGNTKLGDVKVKL
jgi:hypothetical protein